MTKEDPPIPPPLEDDVVSELESVEEAPVTDAPETAAPPLPPLTRLDRFGIVAGGWARRRYDATIGAPPIWPKALVAFAVVVGAFLRLIDLHDLPPGLHHDEAIYAYDAYSLAKTGRDHLGHPFNLIAFETFGDWTPPIVTIIQVPVVALFGLNVALSRAVIAIVGLAGIPIVYLLGHVVTGRRMVGVIAAWLLALSPWHVFQSRWATTPSLAPTVIALLLLALVWALRSRSDRALIWTAVASCLAIASYHTLRLYVPLVFVAALPWYWRTFLRFRPSTLIIAAAIGLFVIGPTVILTLGDPAGGARLEQTSIFTEDSVYLPPGTEIDLPFVIDQYRAYVSIDFLFRRANGSLDAPPGGGVELWTAAPFLLIGLAVLVVTAVRRRSGWQRGTAGLILGSLIFAPGAAMLTLPTPAVLRVTHAMPLLAVTVAIGVVALWDAGGWLDRRRRGLSYAWRGLAVAGLAAAAVALPVELGGRYDAYFDDYRVNGRPNFQYGAEAAIRYALDHAEEYDEVWISGIGEPYAFVLFFAEWDPVDVHARLVVNRDPPWFNGVQAFDRYRFDQKPPPEILAVLPVIETLRTPEGMPMFLVQGGTDPAGRRVLAIYRS